MSLDILVSIENMLNDGLSSNWGSILGRARDFSFLHNIQTDSGTHPASYTEGTFLGINGWGMKLATSSSNAEVRNGRVLSPLPHS
jgi:hypothetical protein